MSQEVIKINTTQESRGTIKFICEKCHKKCTESNTVDSYTKNNKQIFSEFIPLCKRCFKKETRKISTKKMLSNALSNKKISNIDIINWKVKKSISSKEFWDKVNNQKGDAKKSNQKIKNKLLGVGNSPSNIKRKLSRISLNTSKTIIKDELVNE